MGTIRYSIYQLLGVLREKIAPLLVDLFIIIKSKKTVLLIPLRQYTITSSDGRRDATKQTGSRSKVLNALIFEGFLFKTGISGGTPAAR